MATIFCNTTIKSPYSIELDYDQNDVVLSLITYPVGGGFSKGTTFNRGNKIVNMEELHTIIPNEPFSVMARGSSDKFPLVKMGTIRAKNFVLEFRP